MSLGLCGLGVFEALTVLIVSHLDHLLFTVSNDKPMVPELAIIALHYELLKVLQYLESSFKLHITLLTCCLENISSVKVTYNGD